MSKKQTLLSILILLLFCISCAKKDKPVSVSEHEQDQGIRAETYTSPADAQDQGIYIDDNLGYAKTGYFYKIDLNADNEEEIVEVTEPHKLFTNLPEGEWGDDTGAVIRILDRDSKVIYLRDLPRYQPVENIRIDDRDGDGLKEIIVLLGETEDKKAETRVYGWQDNEYKLIKEDKAEIVAKVETIYIGMLTKDLERAGYVDNIQKDYIRVDNEEWIIFSEWKTEAPDDTITFYLVDGKVKGWQADIDETLETLASEI
ncbi:hypothetical protein ACFL0P_04770 [Candidatus Omnitrophota bacterium]